MVLITKLAFKILFNILSFFLASSLIGTLNCDKPTVTEPFSKTTANSLEEARAT